MPEGLWKKKDVADFLGVDERTVERMNLPRVPLEVRPGQKRGPVRYDPAEIREYVERMKRRARGLDERPRKAS